MPFTKEIYSSSFFNDLSIDIGIMGIARTPGMDDTGISIFKFILISAVFIFSAWIITKSFGKKFTARMGGKLVRHVETTSIGMDKKIVVVEVEGLNYIIYTDRNKALLLDKRDDIKSEKTGDENPFFCENTDIGKKKKFTDGFKSVLDDLLKNKKDS